jgi:EmrB/QacA subfamily drug resistance transporter
MKWAPSRYVVIPLIVACGLFMENLDSTVIATALPSIAQSLGEDPLRLNLAITSYLLSLAIFIPVSGWMADKFGARVIFRAAIVVFVMGSIACGLSNTLPELVAARVFQGMGGAMMVPVGRLIMLRSIPKARLVSAMSYLTVPALIGPVIGPPLGGFIVTYFSWRWIFFINIPIGMLGVVLVTKLIENVKEADVPKLDLRGFALIGLALAGLVFGFETIGRGAIPLPATIALLVGGAICAALFAWHAKGRANPAVDFSLLRFHTLRASIFGGFLFRAGIGSLPFLLPMMLQLGFGLSPLSSGLLTFASAAGAMTMKITAGPIIRTWGFRRVLICNAIISGLFLISYSQFGGATPHAVIFIALLAGGFFRSLQFTSVNTLGYADVPPALMSRATSFTSMMQQLSLSVGVGIGALALHLTTLFHGGGQVGPADFMPAFITVGLIAMSSVLFFLQLPHDAGAEVSGHRLAAQLKKEAQQLEKQAAE